MTEVIPPPPLSGVALPQHTLRHKNCPACELALRQAAAEQSMSALTLSAASQVWLSGKISRRLLPKTLECCQGHIRALLRFFGDLPLADFHAGHLRAYQLARMEGRDAFAGCPAGPSAVNHELNALQQMLRKAGLWTPIREFYAPLKEPAWQEPKVFTPVEEDFVFEAAALDPSLELAQIVFRITRSTTASGCELRGLRLRDLYLDAQPPAVQIPHGATKNDVRPRRIALNGDALEAFQRALDRAHRCGSFQPHHFLFPYRVNRRLWDPNRPASPSWLRRQTAILRQRTGIGHLRPHAWRHQAVTQMLERGVPPAVVRATAGWASQKMIERYSHPRMEAIAQAVSVLDRKPPQPVPRRGNLIVFPAAVAPTGPRRA